jgi:hypothetical protein
VHGWFIVGSCAERHRSPAAAAGETLNLEKPSCRRGQVQRLVRQEPLLLATRPPDSSNLRSFSGGVRCDVEPIPKFLPSLRIAFRR